MGNIIFWIGIAILSVALIIALVGVSGRYLSVSDACDNTMFNLFVLIAILGSIVAIVGLYLL